MPRKGVAGWIAGHAAAAVLAWPAAIVLVLLAVRGGMPGVWRLFKDGGGFSWLCALVYTLTLVVLGLLGAWFISGRRMPGWVLFGTALAPFFTGLAGAAMNHRSMMGVLIAESISTWLGNRIFAVGSAEERATLIFGGIMTTLALLLVAFSALGRVMTIDARAVDPEQTLHATGAMGAAAAVSVFGLLVGFGVRLLLRQFHTGFGLVMLLATVSAAIAGAWRAPLAPLLEGEAHGRGDLVRTLLLSALAASAAASFLGYAGGAAEMREGLGAISDESFAASERAHILADALFRAGRAYTIGVVDALLLLGALLVPVLRSGAARQGLRPGISLVGWAVPLLLLVGAGSAYAAAGARDLAGRARPYAFEAAGIAPPVTADNWQIPEGRPTFFITREGRLLVDSSEGRAPAAPGDDASLRAALATKRSEAFGRGDRPMLVVDGEATYGTMLRAMAPLFAQDKLAQAERVHGYQLVLEPQARHVPQLPPAWAALYADPHTAVDLQLDIAPPKEGLLVVVGATSALVLSEDRTQSQKISLGDTDFDDEQRQSVMRKLSRRGAKRLTIAMRDEDTLATAVRILDSMHHATGEDVSGPDRFELTFSPAPPKVEAPPGAEPVVRASNSDPGPPQEDRKSKDSKSKEPEVHTGNIAVNGRLPVEVVQRIVRQSYGRFLLCYEKGLAENPNLVGRVGIKFVIGHDGSVSDASDSGSDLGDPNVVQCVARGFNGLSFPQPEGGGSVFVVYPILFSPGK